jgi:putative DNA primase/helicase
MVCFTREERLSHAKEEFKGLEEPRSTDNEWLKLLAVDKHGFYRATIGNTALILENDPYLKEKIVLNEFFTQNHDKR